MSGTFFFQVWLFLQRRRLEWSLESGCKFVSLHQTQGRQAAYFCQKVCSDHNNTSAADFMLQISTDTSTLTCLSQFILRELIQIMFMQFKKYLVCVCISEENEKKKFICLLIWRQNMREMEGEDEEGRPERRREHQQSPAQFALLDTLSTSTSTSNLPQPALPGSL